ncbi:altered inheritance of mitochondria protein 3-like [Punica granatum]|uniref:SAM domain-containing protein n=2 Tax=Punica granatum TaxID=22663 RepID=A0A218WUQ5_PUNGR|nr:altered inheritance of mitochondria protein 3-like [Punica granatum]OWM76259.1 hypothetical protein CDL15_Pgr009905 [Punica granatum]PKI71413.1 hypothetical protein CRG98_008192 [Punica granatum]
MAAELQPSEEPAAALSSATTATAAATQPQAAAQSEDRPAQENAVPPPAAPKRQRRPSVRLGEIGDHQPAALANESHVRRPKWRLPKDPPNRKARSLTHLVNGNGDSDLDPAHRKQKPKRGIGIGAGFGIGTAAKRVRSSWTSRPEETAEHNTRERDWEVEEEEEEEDEEGDRRGSGNVYRDFERSPARSGDDDAAGTDSWQRRANQAPESENPEGRGDGVRSWLIELGLSRYAPIFEVHEVDDEVLPMLTLEDLKDMGINAVGSRRKMYSAILKLRRGFS